MCNVVCAGGLVGHFFLSLSVGIGKGKTWMRKAIGVIAIERSNAVLQCEKLSRRIARSLGLSAGVSMSAYLCVCVSVRIGMCT